MDKLDILKQNLRQYNRLCVGFSGGVDSTLLLKAAKDVLGGGVFAVIADGIMLPRRELAEAIRLAEEIGVDCHVLKIDALNVPEFKNNGKKRCYYCKKAIFSAIKEKAAELGAHFVADGKNVDDAGVYRPGQQATAELSVVSPLFEAGLTKADIRKLSQQLRLSTWNKPSNACLATRLPYDTEITAKLLHKIEEAENTFEDKNMPGTRARVHGDILRIETQKEYFNQIAHDKQLIEQLKQIGFKYVTLDLEGFRSGSMD